MGKRVSGPPRRPRDPVAKALRTPRFKQQVVTVKRWQDRLKEREEIFPTQPEPPAKD